MAKLEAGYEAVTLDRKEIKVAAVQMLSRRVSLRDPGPGIAANLANMLRLCDQAAGHDLLVFPEFALTKGEPGCCRLWSRNDWLRVAIMVPGPETEAIGRKATELGCHITFASYAQEPDWPGHFFNCSMVVAPSGKVIHRHWKPYYGYPGIGIEYATTVFDVLAEFVRRYGWDAVWPVARTPIGNLATYVCSEGMQQETSRCLAINGAEIFCKSHASGGGIGASGKFQMEFRSDCAYNDCWGIFANDANAEGKTDLCSPGPSMILDPFGQIVVRSKGSGEEIISAVIPIGELRSSKHRFGHAPGNPHMTPVHYRGGLRTEILAPSYLMHQGQFPPDLLTAYQKHHDGALPPDYEAARKWYFDHARWHVSYVDKPRGGE